MTFRSYLLLMFVATLACWASVASVLYAVDPLTSGGFGVLLFYTSLSFALVGTFALLGIVVRKVLFHQEPHFVQVMIAFRQAIFFALLIVAVLALSHLQLLRWWLVLLLIAFFTVIEYLLLSLFQRRSSPLLS